MPSINQMVRSEIRKLARQGKLIDTSFKMFQRQVFRDAEPDQVRAMRICFFAGAAEIFAVMNAGMDDGLAEMDGDLRFMEQWVSEIEAFHERTIVASRAKGEKQ